MQRDTVLHAEYWVTSQNQSIWAWLIDWLIDSYATQAPTCFTPKLAKRPLLQTRWTAHLTRTLLTRQGIFLYRILSVTTVWLAAWARPICAGQRTSIIRWQISPAYEIVRDFSEWVFRPNGIPSLLIIVCGKEKPASWIFVSLRLMTALCGNSIKSNTMCLKLVRSVHVGKLDRSGWLMKEIYTSPRRVTGVNSLGKGK